MASVIACSVNVERRIRVMDIVVDFDVVVNMPLACAMDRDGLRKSSTRGSKSGADIALATESTYGQSGQLKGCVTTDGPIFTVQEFTV